MPIPEIIGSVASAGINFASQAVTNAQNRAQAREAYQRQAEAIQRQNEYNSPSMQVARMRAAGLSPSLAYGASGEMVGNQSEVPEYMPIPAEAPRTPDIGAAMIQASKLGLDIREQMNRDKVANAEVAAKDAVSFASYAQGYLDLATTKEVLSLLDYKIEAYEAENTLTWDKVLNMREQTENLKVERKEIESRCRLNEAEITELAARYGLEVTEAYAILSKLPAEINKLNADAAYAFMQTEVGKEQILNLAAERTDMAFYRTMTGEKFEWEKFEWKNEQDKWIADFKQNRANNFAKNVSNVMGFTIGAAMMRSGQSIPVSPAHGKPSVGHYGGRRTMFQP